MVRNDISPGDQVAQSNHAVIRWCIENIELTRNWLNTSETIVCLGIKNEEELTKLIQRAEQKEIKHSIFREPDMNEEITSAVFEPGENSKKLCSNLGLVLRKIKNE